MAESPLPSMANEPAGLDVVALVVQVNAPLVAVASVSPETKPLTVPVKPESAFPELAVAGDALYVKVAGVMLADRPVGCSSM